MAKPSITTRTAKGSPLTIAEMDNNLTNLQDGYIKIAVPSSRTQQYPSGMITTSTTEKKFGERSASFNGTTNYIQSYYMTGNDNPYNFGMSTFTIEMFVWVDSTGTGERALVEMRGMMTDNRLFVQLNASNNIEVYRGNSLITQTTTPLSTNAWNHIAIERNGYFYNGQGGLYIFTNGAQNGSGWQNTMDSFDNTTSIQFGRDYASQKYFKGYMDEIRVSKMSPRYIPNSPTQTLPFTVPTAEFSNDYNTGLLLHCNDSSGLTDDIYSTFNLDLNDRLIVDRNTPATVSIDTSNKRIYVGVDTNALTIQTFICVGYANSFNHAGPRNARIDFGYNEIYDSQGFVQAQGNGIWQIQNNSSNSQNYLIELYGMATTNATGQIELYNHTNMYGVGNQYTIPASTNIPFAAWQVNIMGNQQQNFSIGINNGSGTETMTGTMWLKITRI